jgi:regulator of RNase E activity RraA
LTTIQIGDALVKLKQPYGGFLDGLKMYSPGGGSIYGPAITVKMVETNSPGPTPPMHFADANKEGHIMYISQPKGMYSACWGGLMSTRAQKLGSLGTMIDGRMRDTQEHIEMGYPVCLSSLSTLLTFYSPFGMQLSFRNM